MGELNEVDKTDEVTLLPYSSNFPKLDILSPTSVSISTNQTTQKTATYFCQLQRENNGFVIGDIVVRL